MPSDIRSFFGGKTQTPIREKETKAEDPKKKKSRSRKVIEDSDDDDEPEPSKKATPGKTRKKIPVKKASPVGKDTTTDDYFAPSNSSRVPKSTPTKSQASAPKIRASARKKQAATSYREHEEEDDVSFLDDKKDGDDTLAVDDKTHGKERASSYSEIVHDGLEKPRQAKAAKTAKISSKDKDDVQMLDISDDASFVTKDKDDEPTEIRVTGMNARSKKRKSVEVESDEHNSKPPAKAVKSVKAQSSKPSPAKKQRSSKKSEPDSSAVKAILDSISTVRPPTPPPKDADGKYNWRQAGGGGANTGPPPAAGSKEIPSGQDNCLAGLSFVFTGLLETLSREEGQELVKRYGGKCAIAPSSKTNFVVLGSDAGPSKLRKIKDLSIKTINEDGLFELIRLLPANGGDGKAAEANQEKLRKEADKIKRDAMEMEAEEKRKNDEAEKRAQKVAAEHGSTTAVSNIRKSPLATSQLWTSKYAPTSVSQICGNKGAVEKIQAWLRGWPLAHKYNFLKRGPEGLGGYRAIIIHGPPGIGKTTAAHLAAKLAGFDVLESNASDTRSKKLVESGLGEVLNNTSLLGYFSGDGKDVDKHKKKIVLVMDEVDGMSAGDRGGVGALAKVCKTTDIPMILICNERKLPKMKPFDHVTFDIPFRRPTVDQVRSRIATICHREGLKLSANVIDALIEGSNKDIRQIINMISTAKLDQAAMDFDQGKSMSKAWEKHVVLKPWDICHKLLGGGMFAPTSKSTLNDKIELYFNDHEFSYLMVQENYLSTKPLLIGTVTGREAKIKALQLADHAAESISDGDLVDRMIHGSQQHWSLMPTHAVFSTVRPASFSSGLMTGQTHFTQWLGNNSKSGRLSRNVKEIQSHMRLRTSGDRHEIRQQYLPVLWTRTVKRLELEGKNCVDEVIDLMDSYFLTKDDYDYIFELGLGPQDMETVSLDTQTKATFTRLYNQRTHPMPFMKASTVTAPAKLKQPAPDLEEAFEEEDDGDVLIDAKDEDDSLDLKKDKYIKQPTKSKKSVGKKSAKGKLNEEGEISNEDHDPVPKKKGKPKVKAGSASRKG